MPFDLGQFLGQIGGSGGGGSGGAGMVGSMAGSMAGSMGGGAGGAGAGAGGGVPWAYIVKQIVGHLAAAGAAYADYRGASIAEDTAGEQQRTTQLLTVVDMVLHGARQDAYSDAVAATLDEIETAYRSPEASRAIDQLRKQFGVAAAGEAAAQATAERGEAAKLTRQSATRRGMRGGSVEEARETREAVGEAVTQGTVEAGRERTERGITRGMEQERGQARAQARTATPPTTGSIMPYQAVLDAQGQLGAAKTEGIMGLKPIIRGTAELIGSALSYGQSAKMDYDAAAEAEQEGRPYSGPAFASRPDEPAAARGGEGGGFSPYSLYDYLGAVGLE